MKKMPVLFLGHGSPMNIVLENAFTNSLVKLGKTLPLPKAILVVSAHWQTKGTYITTGRVPEIIYDFYGFPQELYDVTYPCPGVLDQIEKYSDVFKNAAIEYDDQRGIDHAGWAVLKHMYPNGDIPVMELSLDYKKTPQEHYELGRKLAPLREQGVLIIGSGNIVHNLRMVDWNLDAKPYEWAVKFDDIVKKYIIEQNHEKLIAYKNLGQDGVLSIPTNEHYLPMLYSLGLQEENEKIIFSYEGFQNASISMRGFLISE
ncbi:4,5-DOPA dioxygenase extradiol [Pelosinus sp. sgz500959]|uniref:4,5-DOPA-extradiol-dioxygenase n=1 Tax=Pelosinus sp. sgz500959 TaxID=3242472 RepID=UPI0036722950